MTKKNLSLFSGLLHKEVLTHFELKILQKIAELQKVVRNRREIEIKEIEVKCQEKPQNDPEKPSPKDMFSSFVTDLSKKFMKKEEAEEEEFNL